jgi:hypothetical protein
LFRRDDDEALGIVEGQRAEEECVDDAEDGDVGSDAECENQDGDDGKDAIAIEGADRVAKILEEDVEPRKAAGSALLLACLLDAAETDEGAAAGFVGRHSLADVFFHGEVDVGLELGFEIGVAVLFAEEGEDSVHGFVEIHWTSPRGAMVRTLPITAERRCQ